MKVLDAKSAAARLLDEKSAEIRIPTETNEIVSVRKSASALFALGQRIEELREPRNRPGRRMH